MQLESRKLDLPPFELYLELILDFNTVLIAWFLSMLKRKKRRVLKDKRRAQSVCSGRGIRLSVYIKAT